MNNPYIQAQSLYDNAIEVSKAIADAQTDLFTAKAAKIDTLSQYKRIEAAVSLEISAEQVDGKPRFSNEAARQGELRRRLDADVASLEILANLRDLDLEISKHEIEIDRADRYFRLITAFLRGLQH